MSKLHDLMPFIMMLASAGLIFDHYYILPDRLTEKFKKKCDETGLCPICERPMIVIEEEE